jgi:hypothetical protein
VTSSGPERCPRCNAPVQLGQEYCLDCGNRLVREPSGPVGRASASVAERHDWAGAWLLPALLGLLIAVLGTGAAIAISADGEEPEAIPTATGGSLTVTGGTPTLTAPEPTTPITATTAPSATAPATTAPTNPAAIAWPKSRRGWTIVLLSLPQTNGREAAGAQAKKARDGGLRRVGILDSSQYASLHPGYYVIFHGVYGSEAEAASALQRARTVFPSAYQREIVP